MSWLLRDESDFVTTSRNGAVGKGHVFKLSVAMTLRRRTSGLLVDRRDDTKDRVGSPDVRSRCSGIHE